MLGPAAANDKERTLRFPNRRQGRLLCPMWCPGPPGPYEDCEKESVPSRAVLFLLEKGSVPS
jgi:hypothetical protein